MVLLEKEGELATHQTGHNSGVIHSGVYYTPGTLKAKLCVEGNRKTYEYCDAHGIPYDRVGKLIVAVDESEMLPLMKLWYRAKANGVEGAQLLQTAEEVRAVEPHCAGVMAVRCPSTGVVDWARVARSYGTDFEEAGGEILLRREVVDFEGAEGSGNFSGGSTKGEAAPFSPVIVRTSSGEGIVADRVVVCGGLHADRLAAKGGCDPEPRIVPFRGDYLLLDESKRHLVKGNIYPVPDARYPFLGVHFTPRPDGEMWLGPNAVFAFSREGYTMGTFSLRDMWDAFSFEGFRALAWKNLAFGVDEMWRAVYLPAQVARLQRYIPELTLADVKRGPSGVRAQALDAHGSLVEDFVFHRSPRNAPSGAARALHCRNAPSPAATSSLAIGAAIADEAAEAFGLPVRPPAPVGKVAAQGVAERRRWWKLWRA
eukprot:PRCOL_00000521-RA